MPLFLAFLSFVLGVGLVAYGSRQYGKSRILEAKKPMRIGSVRGGFFAFRGKVEPLELLRSPHSGKECVYYRVLEEKWVKGGKGNRRNKSGTWKNVREEVRAVDFLLADDTGKARVISEGAEWHVKVDQNRALSNAPAATADNRMTETYVLPGDDLSVLGQARPTSGAARMTISREGAPIFLITDKPKGVVLGNLRTVGSAGLVSGSVLVLLSLVILASSAR